MKKFLMVVGGIAIVLVVLIAALVAVVAVKGRGLDKESKQYADIAIVAIVANWDEQALLVRASPEFLKVAPTSKIDQLFWQLRTLGPMEHYLGSKGDSYINIAIFGHSVTTALYIADVVFQGGAAKVRVRLIKHGDHWQILEFYVHADDMPPAHGAATT
jgi:hypothetical protein